MNAQQHQILLSGRWCRISIAKSRHSEPIDTCAKLLEECKSDGTARLLDETGKEFLVPAESLVDVEAIKTA